MKPRHSQCVVFLLQGDLCRRSRPLEIRRGNDASHLSISTSSTDLRGWFTTQKQKKITSYFTLLHASFQATTIYEWSKTTRSYLFMYIQMDFELYSSSDIKLRKLLTWICKVNMKTWCYRTTKTTRYVVKCNKISCLRNDDIYKLENCEGNTV